MLRQHLHRLEVWERPEQTQRLGLGQPADDLSLAEKPNHAAIRHALQVGADLISLQPCGPEAFRQAVSTLLAPVIDTGPLSSASGRIAPMLFVVIPIGAVALATRWQLHRTEGAGPAARIAWAAVVGLPFGLLMLAFAVLGGDSDVTNVSPSAGSAFGLGLLWGVVGGALGAATALPLEGAVAGRKLPAPVGRVLTAATATVRAMAPTVTSCSPPPCGRRASPAPRPGGLLRTGSPSVPASRW